MSKVEPKAIAIVAENDAVTRDLVRMALERLGCKVILSESGEEVPMLVERYLPEILVVDTFLPHKGGLELFRQIHSQPRLQSVKVFVLSRLEYEHLVDPDLPLDRDDFFNRPLDVESFSRRVNQILNDF